MVSGINIPRIPECITVFIAGPVASGKTFLIKQLVRRMERSLILDAGADYLEPDYEHIWSSPRQLAQRIESNPYYYRIAYHPNAEFFDEEFRWCFASIWSTQQLRWFIIEEAHKVCQNGAMNPSAETILRFSRHNFLGVIASSQRIADVDKLLTGGARMVILFSTPEIRDIEAAGQRWGSDVADALEKLRPCIYNDATTECEQHPECLVYMKGHGFRVFSLGSKIKAGGDEEIWESNLPEQQERQEQSSSEQDSGQQEEKLPESMSEASQQD
jgi:hypothetical protein